MRNENGESRGFGFVSYQTPDQGKFHPSSNYAYTQYLRRLAAAAMHGMNGAVLGTKQLVVRLHEPKQLRQEKLAQRFGGNGHPRSASGATSPTISEAGESFAGWSSPRYPTSALGSPVAATPDRGRRGSGSYYNVRVSMACLCDDVLHNTFRLPSAARSIYQCAMMNWLHCHLSSERKF